MSNSKADWKLFLEILPEWQERHIGKLLEEYKAILEEDRENGNAEIFWKLHDRINKDKKSYGVGASISPSEMPYILRAMAKEGIVSREDLEGFSSELIEFLYS